MIFDIELLVQKMLNLLFFPRLAFTQKFDEFGLLILIELRGPTAPEVRCELPETSFVPAIYPVCGSALRFTNVISGFLQRSTFVQPFEKYEAFEFLPVIGLAEKTIKIVFAQMSDDLLFSTSHYNKEILILNNFPESL